ncbi:Exonuclease 1 [Sergentomyia squamirostris]
MGITGLIPFLEKSSRQINLREIKNTTVAVDTYCLLHKGAYACADKLARGEETTVHIQYCLKYVKMLLSHNIKPIMVFDGRHLPAKELTESRRRDSRQQARSLAGDLLREGKTDEARKQMRRCVDITHEMALEVIQECRKLNVDSIVAPYEADAQLAYLNLCGIAQYVVTEDSDLLLFGCSRTLFKLDLAGNALFVDASKIHISMGCRLEKYTFDRFLNMCILSGCDYLDSLPGIGLARACKFFLMTEETNLRRCLLKVPIYLKMKHLTVTEEYIEQFIQAVATFKHMWVFDPISRRMVRMTEPDDSVLGSLENAGSQLDEKIAFQLALGNLDPFTLKPLDNWDPDTAESAGNSISRSIWRRGFNSFSPKSPKRKQRNVEVLKTRNHSVPEEKSSTDLYSIYLEDSPSSSPSSSLMPPPASPVRTPPQTSSPLKRNPFRKSLETSAETVEVEISPSYVSGVKNATSSDSDSGQENTGIPRIGKFSKFPRTVINSEQNVVSRFFFNGHEDEVIQTQEINEKTPEKSPIPAHLSQIYDADQISAAVRQNLLNMFNENVENQPSPEKIVQIKSPPRKIRKISPPKPAFRVSGLKKPKTATGDNKKMVQSTLSKFGFFKK